MKKQFFAAAMALCMAVGSVWSTALPAYGRATTTDIPVDSGYNYRDTTKLEADYVNGALILTWPAVAKDGTLLNQNPLASSYREDAAPGDPMGGWTQPYKGLLINYNGYSPEYSPNKLSISLTGDEDVIMGVVSGEAEGCQTVLNYGYPTGTAPCLTGEKSHIDQTVVAKGYASNYKIEYSTDGVNYTVANTTNTVVTQKKLALPVIDGVTPKTDANGAEYILDNKNTVFIVSQQVERFPSSVELEEGQTYYIKIVPTDKAGSEITPADPTAFVTQVTAQSGNTIKVPAYPTVEGGGIWTSGGRTTLTTQGQVYTVTSLEDNVTDPQPGTFRYGLQKARANENIPLTIVFAVGGTIHIDPAAAKSQRRFTIGSNITIAGQTAPGEGITIAGGTCNISGSNIIMRYMRFRLGEGYDLDGANAQGKNIIVDHCSFGWGVDETFSTKALVDSTISNNIVSSGLAMVNKNGDNNTDPELLSGEGEFKHGMGSIMNGYETTFTHNVWAHNGTRNPRFEGGFEYNGTRYENKMEFANNVIYNWGHMSSYGGDRGTGEVNFEGNYYKTGPNTLQKVKDVFFDCDTDATYGNVKSSYYVAGNYMEGNDTLNADNTKGFKDLGTAANKLDTPVELKNGYTPTDALTAYDYVLENVGASLCRDAQDNRLIDEIKNGTGRFINSEEEAGGYNDDSYYTNAADTDGDGIPDFYETILGTNAAADDSTVLITDEANAFYGYTPIDIYINDVSGDWGSSSPAVNAGLTTNSLVPRLAERTVTSNELTITAIKNSEGENILGAVNTDLIAGETYTIETANASAISSGKTQVLFNNKSLTEVNGSQIQVTPTAEGSYLMQLKYSPNNADGLNPYTLSEAVEISVVGSLENIPGYTETDIGAVPQAGASSYNPTDGSVIIEGSGLIGRTSSTSTQGINGGDAFYFDYVEHTGNFDYSARVETLSKVDYFQKAGLMVRASLDPTSEFYMSAVTYVKGEDYEAYKGIDGNSILAKNIWSLARTTDGGQVSVIDTTTVSKLLSIAQVRKSETPNQSWVRIVREGQTISVYGGKDGENWTLLNTYQSTLPDKVYLGMAIDSIQDATTILKYNKARISSINLSSVTTPDNHGNGIVGDVDQNGVITANDAAALLAHVRTNYTAEGWNTTNHIADTNNDNTKTAADAAEILKKVINSATRFERTNN